MSPKSAKAEEPRKLWSGRLRVELLEALKARAKQEDRNVSWLIEKACEQYLKKEARHV